MENKIIVIDDEPEILSSMKEILEMEMPDKEFVWHSSTRDVVAKEGDTVLIDKGCGQIQVPNGVMVLVMSGDHDGTIDIKKPFDFNELTKKLS